jgi:hypothetical protein
MSSDLACVGLAMRDANDFNDLVREIGPRATLVGVSGDVQIARWQDESGARVVFRVRRNRTEAFVPSYAGTVGIRFGTLTRLSDDVWSAAAVDESGEQWTGMTFEIEEGGLINDGHPSTAASLVALGRAVTVHSDERAFAASDASLLGGASDPESEPPAHYAERGWPWPPRMAAESFASHGVFVDPADAPATALLNGTVLRAERRINGLTGQDFIVVRTRSLEMEVDMCLAGSDHATIPEPGQVIGGTVFLVASLVSHEAAPDRPRSPRSLLTGLIGR